MYSPKIKEEYIPIMYRIAKRRRIHMTALVNEIIATELEKAIRSIKGNRKRQGSNTRS
jgi:hypothetical protein